MSQLTRLRAINQRTLWAFVSVLFAAIIVAAIIILSWQQQHLMRLEKKSFQTQMALLGELATEALLRADYATVENLVQRWANSHDNITAIKIEMPNGFMLADIHKNVEVINPIQIIHHVNQNRRTLMIIHATSDVATMQTGYTEIVIKITLVLLIIVLALGWLFWITVKRTALAPLQAQIVNNERQEQKLKQRTTELESALKELETFSYSVSHDLRSPLRAIDGFSRVVLEDHDEQLNEEARNYLHRIVVAAQRMGKLIDDLLALSRVSRRELVVTDVNLSALAHDVIDELKDHTPTRQVKVDIAPDLYAKGDAQLLRVVLSNLLGNAWKYTGKKTAAHIDFASTLQSNNPPLFCIRDNGAGFDMQYANKLFQPFQRLHTADEFPGSGIGLATVARVIERHGGRIWAEGQPGTGTIVCFTLEPADTSSPTVKNRHQSASDQL